MSVVTTSAGPQVFSSNSPLRILLPYQVDWLMDDARFKIGMAARQIGKSMMTAAEAVTDCYRQKTKWVILSAGERQALEWMEKAREWVEAYDLALEGYEEERDGGSEALLKKAEIILPNGSRVIAIPANPATARGYSCNVILDEFAIHENPDEIWRSVYPSVSNPLKGLFKLRVVSTPKGQGNKFYDLWSKDNNYSKHKIDIYTAVARGLPIDIEELRAGMDDPEGWAQEFECQFIDSTAILLTYELIAGCESPTATCVISPEYWSATREQIDLGIDFGRKKDLTVCWALADLNGYQITREVLELRKMATDAQLEVLRPRLARCRRCAFDYTGPGVGLGDLLVKEFGEYKPEEHKFGKIKLITFTNAIKQDVFPKLRVAFDQRKLGIPISRDVREDLHSVHRTATSNGMITYRAPHTEDGHADRATALALAVHIGAEGQGGVIRSVEGIRIGRPAISPPKNWLLRSA